MTSFRCSLLVALGVCLGPSCKGSRPFHEATPISILGPAAAAPTRRQNAPEAGAPQPQDGRERAVRLIRESPFAGSVERLSALLVPSIVMTPRCFRPPEPPLGGSRLGGMPDVSAGFAWPTVHGRPLGFLAQIRLDEITPYDPEHRLPRAGWLLFFYDVRDQPWGADPDDQAHHRVIHITEAALQHAGRPGSLPDQDLFPRCALTFEQRFTLPDLDDVPGLAEALEAAPATPKQYAVGTRAELFGERRSAYSELCERLTAGARDTDPNPEFHLLLGNPMSIQGPVAGECARAAGAWQLLLQLDSHILPKYPGLAANPRATEEGEWSWGDAGRLYFMIREPDLKAARFDRTCFVLQCY
jgi:hypothetical protein